MTIRRHAISALAIVAVAAAALLPRAASASKADAFEGKIQPVSGQLYRKAGKLELTAGLGMSLNDAFFTKYLGDLKLGYHFTEHWSASIHGVFAKPFPTSSTTVCPTGAACRDAYDYELNQLPGRVRAIAGLEAAWSPIYGKLNTFSEKVAHIDLSLLAGVDFIQHDEVLSTADAETGGVPAVKTGTLPSPLPFGPDDLPFGVHVGVGVRIFVQDLWFIRMPFAIRFDLKDYIYGVTVPNGTRGLNGTDIQNQLIGELGLSFFFPTLTSGRQP